MTRKVFELDPRETVLDDDCNVFPLYVYIVDGVFSRYHGSEPTTIGEWKKRAGIKEIRRCEIFNHPEARLGDRVEIRQ